jgi:RNA polymerase subunit RPABC4/transcription elongation factor Spt4
MDNLDRMFRHLVRTVRSRFPQYLTQPFEVGELHQTILPYRHHRRELGLETNEDYEITLTELLSGARDYLSVEERMRDVLSAELKSNNPDPSAFKRFATEHVSLSPAAVRTLEVGPDEDASQRISNPPMNMTAERRSLGPPPTIPRASAAPVPPPVSAAPSAPSPTPPPPTPTSQPVITPKAVVPQPGERCRACDEVLPPGRPITFCPHCGQNVTTVNCPACGSELEVGWKFCPTCGRRAADG